MIWRAVLVVVLIAGALAAAGCGGGDSPHQRKAAREPAAEVQRSQPPEEEQGRRREVPGVPEADRIGYYQVATTTGTLRVAVAGIAAGRARAIRPRELAALRAAERRLRALAPHDPALRAALAALRPQVRRVARGRPTRQTARDALAATTDVSSRLRDYLGRHPALAASLPD